MDPKLQRQSTTRILLLGGGFAGVYTARRLEKLFARNTDVQITLVSRDNFLLMTPLMSEVCTGTLAMDDCSISVREFVRKVRFVEAIVDEIDLEHRLVRISLSSDKREELAYDQLVLAMGGLTNTSRIPGSELAFTFKTLADAVLLRNHVIERMERAETESDPELRSRELTFVIIGGGLVGVEVFGELTAFMDEMPRYYPGIRRKEIQLYLLEASERIMPELSEKLAQYSSRVLSRRPGVSILTSSPVERITSQPSPSEDTDHRGFHHHSVGRHHTIADNCSVTSRKRPAGQNHGRGDDEVQTASGALGGGRLRINTGC